MGKARRAAPKKSAAAAGRDGDASTEHHSPTKGRKGNKKNKGRAGWADDVAIDLASLGLRVHEVAADGSCFFRSLEDQMGGAGGDFRELRQRIIAYMKEHREDFEPFVEDDEPFDDYIERMREEGTWAGNLELQAASMELQVNIKVYQASEPVWTIKNFGDDAPVLHLSYHDGIHYNSVRMANDFGPGPPEPICVPKSTSGAGVDAKGSDDGTIEVRERDLKRVLDGTGCCDRAKAESFLRDARGDVENDILLLAEELASDAAVAHSVPEIMATAEAGKSSDELDEHKSGDTLDGKGLENELRVELEVSRGGKGRKVQVHLFINGIALVRGGGGSETQKAGRGGTTKRSKEKEKIKAPSRNSRCPCGSTKTYKNCCGTASQSRKSETTAENFDTSSSAATTTATKALETLYI